jgi:hypothetical protein
MEKSVKIVYFIYFIILKVIKNLYFKNDISYSKNGFTKIFIIQN